MSVGAILKERGLVHVVKQSHAKHTWWQHGRDMEKRNHKWVGGKQRIRVPKEFDNRNSSLKENRIGGLSDNLGCFLRVGDGDVFVAGEFHHDNESHRDLEANGSVRRCDSCDNNKQSFLRA